MWRAALRPDSLLSFEEASDALPCSAPVARTWLAQQPAFGCIDDVPVYRWSDLVDLIRAGEGPTPANTPTRAWMTTADVADHLGINRSTLDEMVAKAPRSLPGSPLQIGTGRKNRHLRWDMSRLDEWLAAFETWQVGEKAPASPKQRPSARRPRKRRKTRRSLLAMVDTRSD
jgi:predicted DNA-binding transcriptional regulator AlpA